MINNYPQQNTPTLQFDNNRNPPLKISSNIQNKPIPEHIKKGKLNYSHIQSNPTSHPPPHPYTHRTRA